MKLSDIKKPKGANKAPIRVGRGVGSGRGKTSGRGHKGAKARAGASLRIGFEGGQMPLIRRIPKRGFTNINKSLYQIVNIKDLQQFKKDSVIDKQLLKKAGIIKNLKQPVKVLGDGDLKKILHVMADAFSASAKKKIAEAGGKAEIIKRGK